MKNLILNISGMTCAACAKSIERVCRKLEGVETADVNFAAEKLSLTFDETKITLDAITAVVKRAGFDLSIPSATRVFKIEGMTCAACAKNIERVCGKSEGVVSADVNFAAEKLNLTYNTAQISIVDIMHAVERAGFKLLEEETIDAEALRKV